MTARELLLDRNRAAVLAFEMMWGIAIPFVYYSTVVPGFLRHLGASNTWIGVGPAFHSGIVAVIQPWSAYAFRHHRGNAGWLRRVYATGAWVYVALGVAVLCGMRAPGLGIAAALLTTLLFSIATGIGDPHYMDLVVSAAPPVLRGRFFGLRVVFLGLGGIVGGVLAEQLLKAAPVPMNYGVSFVVGGLLYVASTQALHACRPVQPGQESQVKEHPDTFKRFLGETLLPLAARPQFRSFLSAAVIYALAVAVFPFLSLLIRERLHAGEEILGLLGGLVMAANLIFSWLLGALCDRFGSRTSFGVVLIGYVVGLLLCLTLAERTGLLLAYFLTAIWMPGLFVPVTNLALELAARDPERPATAAESTSLLMAAMSPGRIMGPIAVGAALDHFPVTAVFIAAAGLACISLTILTCSKGRDESKLSRATRWTRR